MKNQKFISVLFVVAAVLMTTTLLGAEKDRFEVWELNVDPSPYEVYKCMDCGYLYFPIIGDEQNGVPSRTPFNELPDDWVCPNCGCSKEHFVLIIENKANAIAPVAKGIEFLQDE